MQYIARIHPSDTHLLVEASHASRCPFIDDDDDDDGDDEDDDVMMMMTTMVVMIIVTMVT